MPEISHLGHWGNFQYDIMNKYKIGVYLNCSLLSVTSLIWVFVTE